MDSGRYVLQQGWDTNSALEGYGSVHEPDFRASGSYAGRRYLDEGFSGDPLYARSTFHQDILKRDVYPPPPPVSGIWPQARRRGFDDEYGLVREPRRHNKPYVESFYEMDNFQDIGSYHGVDSFHEADQYHDTYRSLGGHRDTDSYHDYRHDDRHARLGGRDCDEIGSESYEFRHHPSHQSREKSCERDYDVERYSYDSDHERSSRDSSWRRRDSHDHEKRGLSWERDLSPYGRRDHSRSHGRDDRSRSRSPLSRSRGRSHREGSYDDSQCERSEKRRDRDRDEKRLPDSSVAPSATVVVKGLSQKMTEEDLHQILSEWGPLQHVRVIKERNSGVSRGFAFIDFPNVEAARSMMDSVREDGLVFDGRKLLLEYSSKPSSGAGGPFGHESNIRSRHGHGRSVAPPSDWMCTICNCINFARRTSCFQCNEARTDDAPPANVATSNLTPLGKKGLEAGPTHVLAVRGLDENADEEMLRYEFSKHAPIKDLRLIRDKFTHVSRGFAFVHFYSVEDATKALEATNGTTLEKNGQALRVAFAKSIHRPGSGASQSSSLATAAIEAATFAQQYDAVGWAPKEYNPDAKQSTGGDQSGQTEALKAGSAPQSGFVWDEKSGYYYDAASGFYYEGNTGLYYDGNTGIWYSYDHQNQQYVPCRDQCGNKASGESSNETSKATDAASNRKIVISAPATTTKSNEKASLPDAVQAAAAVVLAAEKKEKEKLKEIKSASKRRLLANKKKMNNVLAMWKQRNHEGQAARVVLDDNRTSGSLDDKQSLSHGAALGLPAKGKFKSDAKDTTNSSGFTSSAMNRAGSNTSNMSQPAQTVTTDSQIAPRPVSNSVGGTLMGVIRGSGRVLIKSDTSYSGSSSIGNTALTAVTSTAGEPSMNAESVGTPFKTDASALGSYSAPVAAGNGKRRFSEMPMQSTIQREQSQTTYRDRAAERRSLYGTLSSSIGDDLPDVGPGGSNRDYSYRGGSSSDLGTMPFPPGIGGGQPAGDAQGYEVITVDRALDESNVGNRMLRIMGWQEGSGLGKNSSGIKEPVQSKVVADRAGLGNQRRKTVEPRLEARAGDSHQAIIQKKAIARFQEMA